MDTGSTGPPATWLMVCELHSPFVKLAAAGLMPEHSQPRARVLQVEDLPAWREAVNKLGEKQRDYLLLTLYTGLRRNECRELTRQQIDLAKSVLSVPMTKNRKPHSLPIIPMMREVLERRCLGLAGDAVLFMGMRAAHAYSLAMQPSSPKFMLITSSGRSLDADHWLCKDLPSECCPCRASRLNFKNFCLSFQVKVYFLRSQSCTSFTCLTYTSQRFRTHGYW